MESSNGGSAAIAYISACNTVSQYVKFTIKVIQSGIGCGAVFRYTGTESDGYYVVYVTASSLVFARFDNTGQIDYIEKSWTHTLDTDETVGFTIKGTGTATVVSVWENPVGNTPYSADDWADSDDPPAFSIPVAGEPNEANFIHNTGTRIGIGGFFNEGTNAEDDWYGGDCPTP